jgi:sigma-B regulation protein RsbU (phosphoserine phosphatase)
LRSIASRISISIGLPILISLLVLAIAVTIGYIGYYRARVTAHSLEMQNLRQIHDRIADRLQEFFALPERLNNINVQLVMNAQTSSEGAFNRAHPRQWRLPLYEQIRAFDSISSIIWGDSAGWGTFVSRYPYAKGYVYGIVDEQTGGNMHEYHMDADGGLSPEPWTVYSTDPRTRPWYLAAVEAGHAVWTEPYTWIAQMDADPVLSIGYVTPVSAEQGGELIGVMNVEFSLADIDKFLHTLPIGTTGKAFIVDQDRNLVGTSDDTPILQPGTDMRVPAHNSASTLIAAGAARVIALEQRHPGATMRQQHSSIELAGENFLLMTSPFVRSGELLWRIVTVVPENDFLGEIKDGERQVRQVVLLSILVALILGIAIARFLTRPIVKLTEHAREIGHGNLDQEVRLSEFPEFVRLSAAMNRMVEGLRERLVLRESLVLAKEVQQRLLPSVVPRIPGLEIVGHSEYCDETGGDYYDFLEIAEQADDSAVIAVGDVSGHGIASAMVMASARGILRSRSRDACSLGTLLQHTNTQVAEDTSGGRYMTMLLVQISARRRCLRWVSAGHREPIVYDASSGGFAELSGGDIPLGIMRDQIYHEHSFDGLHPGHVVLLATDGLWEMVNADGEQFGMERVRDVLRRFGAGSVTHIKQALIAELSAFRGVANRNDDLTFVLVRIVE